MPRCSGCGWIATISDKAVCFPGILIIDKLVFLGRECVRYLSLPLTFREIPREADANGKCNIFRFSLLS